MRKFWKESLPIGLAILLWAGIIGLFLFIFFTIRDYLGSTVVQVWLNQKIIEATTVDVLILGVILLFINKLMK